MSQRDQNEIVSPDLVQLDARATDKTNAIRQAAALLETAGCVTPGFADSMMRREAASNTFLGKGIAIPHGMVEDRDMILRDGIAILQLRAGTEWNDGQTARLVVAIAARSDAHLDILRRLTRLMQDDATIASLETTDDHGVVIAAMTGTRPDAPAAVPVTDFAHRFVWTVDYPNGLHARPATEWAEAARRFAARIRVRHNAEAADARNMIALLQLGLKAGDEITLSAEGSDAADALSTLKVVLAGLSTREKADAQKAAQKRATATPGTLWTPPGSPRSVEGVSASPGMAIGHLHRMVLGPQVVKDTPIALADAADRLHSALGRARQQLHALADDTARRLGAADAGIFRAQAELLKDPELITLASQKLVEGHGLAWSWNAAFEETAKTLETLGNPVLAGRAIDLRDVGRRVLALIDPALARPSLAEVPMGTILIADDLTPTDTAALDPKRIVGLVTAQGGPTSHTAILARTLGLPAIVGAGAILSGLVEDGEAVIDGTAGRLYLALAEDDLSSARDWIATEADKHARAVEARAQPATTRDGHNIAIGANINLAEQAAFALEQGAEAVGLMRTEFLFLERGDSPSEEMQYQSYLALSEAMGGRTLVIRALDIGGDKQVTYLGLPREDNPFLGVRGARLLLRRPELFVPQMRALYRTAKAGADINVMFPMITSVAELRSLRATCEQIRTDLDAPVIPLGIMIEVPSAALLAEELAKDADFFSIGTNDLTQYTLAIDRQNPVLAPEADSLHPAVLKLIDMTVKGAHKHGRWVGVCGGMAGDAYGAALLAGLGVDELSMTPHDIPAVKERLRMADMDGLRDLAQRALNSADAAAVRHMGTEVQA